METSKTILARQESWFNPYFFNGNEVNKIIIFNENGEIFNFRWLGYGSNNDTDKLFFDFEIKRAIKVDFSRKYAFYHKVISRDEFNIYIPADFIQFEDKGSIKKYENIYGHSVYQVFEIKVFCIKPTFEKQANGDYKKISQEPQWHKFEIEKFISKEKSEKGREAEEISARAKSVGVDLFPYELEKLSKVLNITLK